MEFPAGTHDQERTLLLLFEIRAGLRIVPRGDYRIENVPPHRLRGGAVDVAVQADDPTVRGDRVRRLRGTVGGREGVREGDPARVRVLHDDRRGTIELEGDPQGGVEVDEV